MTGVLGARPWGPRASACPPACCGRTCSRMRGFLPSFPRRRGPPPAASWRWRSARSRTRCSTPRASCWGCPATNCSAARPATARTTHPGWYKPAITDLDGVKAIGREVCEKKFTALKTNIFTYTDRKPQGWRPGFGSPFEPEINVDRKVLRDLRMHLEAIRDGAGPDVDILLDLNFNAKTEGYLKILRAIADLDMFWIEIDSFNPEALGYIRRQSSHPISSCETLLGLREFLPYFREQAMDVAIIDTPWNGVWQSMKIASAAEAYEVNVAPHNFYGHLCSMMNAHFCAAVPNLRIMEIDIDRLEWDHELFTHLPEIADGYLVIPDRPGWGTPNEEALRAHPPKGLGGLLNYGRKA